MRGEGGRKSGVEGESEGRSERGRSEGGRKSGGEGVREGGSGGE